MPDPVTTVGIGVVAAYVGKDIVLKILGPTADYLGGELREVTQRRMENIGRTYLWPQSLDHETGKTNVHLDGFGRL